MPYKAEQLVKEIFGEERESKLKTYAPWIAAFGIPLAVSFFLRKPSKLTTPKIQEEIGDFKSRFERFLIEERRLKLEPEAKKVYTKTLRSLRRKKIPQNEAMQQAMEAAEAFQGKKIEIKATPPDQYLFDNLEEAIDRYIAGDIRTMLDIAEKEWLPKLGRKTFPRWWHPEAVSREHPSFAMLYNLTRDKSRETYKLLSEFNNKIAYLIKKYKLRRLTQDEIDRFIFFHENKSRLSESELRKFPRWMHELSKEYKDLITDPIWREASRFDPAVRYRRDYFTHFPVEDRIRTLKEELARLKAQRKGAPDVLVSAIDTEIKTIERLLKESSLQKAALDVLKARSYARKGYFGPLEHARKAGVPYEKDFEAVTRRYVRGAIRKIFLDKYLPDAVRLINLIDDPILKEQAWNYVQLQKSTFGSFITPRLGETLQSFFRRIPIMKRYADALHPQIVDSTINFLINFQYLAKLGLDWIRWPIVNLTQSILTTLPLVGPKAFLEGLKKVFTREGWEVARKAGATSYTFEAVTEILGGKPWTWTRRLSLPGQFAEAFNRVLSYHAGLFRGKGLGLKGSALERYALNVIDYSQWPYARYARPPAGLTPLGRFVWQFKIFSMNYIKWLSDLAKTDPKAFSRALSSLFFLSGTGMLPFYDKIQDAAARLGVVLPDQNITIFISDIILGLRPAIDLGASINPFFIPWRPEDWAGPVLAPALRSLSHIAYGRWDQFKKELEYMIPPLRAAYLGAFERLVESPAGRVLGERAPLEFIRLARPFESRRYEYMRMIQAAMEGGKFDTAYELMKRAREEGILISRKDLATIKARITRKKREER